MNGMTITASTSAAVKMPVPNGGPANRSSSTGMPSNAVDQRWLDVLRHERNDDEEAPHAVDDRGNRGEQLDPRCRPGGAATRRQLGQIERDAESQRHRQDQRQHRGHQRAVDRHRGAEDLLHRIPVVEIRKPAPNWRNAGSPPMNSDEDHGCQAAAGRKRQRCRRARHQPGEQRDRRSVDCAGERLPERDGRLVACDCAVDVIDRLHRPRHILSTPRGSRPARRGSGM